ncbi:FAD-binding dehydrogenase [Luteipulveratus halotolerans]|uniref:FAD-binding dehydrogenase n=1 Tax=Luteipulveratus halotolerans TaxID=1631356 RepID=A0A0L6CLT5_9MICO|nr:FAD-binding dehydrogenase [Luteipulveratus halotolerans]KNX38478.1 FAD-binding dehydrogenase [Luteipulveratus halotolerans]
MDADVIVVGAGLAGLVATSELIAAGKKVVVVDQENDANLGGQAWWSFGGLFLVDTPEQRRLGVKDSFDLAWQDWQGSAGWDRLADEDSWASKWGRAYVEWAAGEKRDWLRGKGIRFTPMVGWAERGDGRATGHGNSVPRFHIAWGTGTGVVKPFVDAAVEAAKQGLITFKHRHRVDELIVEGGAVVGVRGTVLAPDHAERGAASNRDAAGDFELRAQAVVVSTGGIGGNHDLVREFWPERLGQPPRDMITGVPAYVDGRGIGIAQDAGARLVNRDRMWHYVEGIQNWAPVWPKHAIRILPGPSPLWFDALGRLLPAPYLPGYDTLGTLRYLRTTPDIAQYDHSWFIVTQKMIEKEFALSGSEQNPDITGRDLKLLAKTRLGKGAPGPVEAFKSHGADFVVAERLSDLVAKMNALTESPLLDADLVEKQIVARDREMTNPYTKDAQVQGIHNARRYRGDKLARVASPHRVLDPKAGPLIGVKLHVLTRKSLGGIQTDLSSQALTADGTPIPGLYAAGEAAGFGGGGVHGYNALEGTFLGGCLFSGRAAGRAIARAI